MLRQEAIVIVGATSQIAQKVVAIWTKRHSAKVVLIARDLDKLLPIASELQSINPKSEIICKELDFTDIQAANDLIEHICNLFHVSKVLIAFGVLPKQAEIENDFYMMQDSLNVNGVLPIIFSEMFISRMRNLKFASLAIIGSVSGDRGRKSNYFYGAAKSMLDTYVQGVRHRLYNSPLHVCIIKPGPTDTPMTKETSSAIKLADPQKVALDIVNGIRKKRLVIYTPPRWKVLMFLVRNLPESIFNKLDI